MLFASMDLKVVIFILLASLFLATISARVSPDVEEHFTEIAAVVVNPPARAPVPAPAPAPKSSTTPAPIIAHDAKGCSDACKGRCALHSRQNVCNRACMTCCSTCHCVPPGTYGYRELCGTCYSNWLTHGNRTKCP